MDTIVAIDLLLGFWSRIEGEIEGAVIVHQFTTLN